MVYCFNTKRLPDLLLIVNGIVSKGLSSLAIFLVLETLQCDVWISTQYTKFHCHKG